MTDKLSNTAWDSYERECSSENCNHVFNAPGIDTLLLGYMICPKCREEYSIDAEDMYFLVAFLLAKVERLERRTNPFAGIDL